MDVGGRILALFPEHLTEEQYSAVSWLAIAMNAFNRVSITSQHPVRPEKG